MTADKDNGLFITQLRIEGRFLGFLLPDFVGPLRIVLSRTTGAIDMALLQNSRFNVSSPYPINLMPRA